jgi:hypothetical protein
MHSVAVELSENADGLRPELRDPSDAAAKRHRPQVAAAGLPVGGDDGRHPNEPAFFQVVVDEVLRQELIHIGVGGRRKRSSELLCGGNARWNATTPFRDNFRIADNPPGTVTWVCRLTPEWALRHDRPGKRKTSHLQNRQAMHGLEIQKCNEQGIRGRKSKDRSGFLTDRPTSLPAD